jgi:hypothetical protein
VFSYAAYGLGIYSALPLPELVASEVGAEVDIVICLGSIERLPSEADNQEGCFYATPESAYFFWEGVGAFLVRNGCEIIIEPTPGVDERVLRIFIVGVALGVLLHQRGLLVLHASAVAINGSAIAFVGEKGAGKSTTAAALHARGHSIVADDIVALQVNGPGSPMILPGFPQLKLWPDAVTALGEVPEALPQVHPQFEKRARRVAHGFLQVHLPLSCIYVLSEGRHHQIEPLRPQEIFEELMCHSYAVRFLGAIGTPVSHFHQCVRLANSVPICSLKRPRSLSALLDLAWLVEEHSTHNIQ